MNTKSAVAIAASLLLPAAAGASGEGAPWSVAVGLSLPAFSAGAAEGSRELPTFLAVSAPFRSAGYRLEPELAVGSGRTFSPFRRHPAGVPIFDGEPRLPVSTRWYRLGVVAAPEWAPASGARLYAGPWAAAILRHEALDTSWDGWSDDFLDFQLGAAGGAEIALSPSVALGAALRVGATVLEDTGAGGFEPTDDGEFRRVRPEGGAFLTGEAQLSVRIAL